MPFTDRVQVLKYEESSKGGDDADSSPFPSEIEPQEDGLEASGFILQDGLNRDETTVIDRDGNDMRFKDGNNPTPVTLSDLLGGGSGTASTRAFDAYDAAGGVSLVAGWTDIPLTVQRTNTTQFTFTPPSAEITFDEDGVFVILARVTYEQNGGNSRSDCQIRLQIDTGGGFVTVPGTLGSGYSRQNTQGQGTMVTWATIQVTAGDVIKMQAQRRSGGGTILTLAEGSSIELFSPSGAKGDKGDQGDPGVGIDVKDVLVSGDDTTSAFLEDKIVAGTNITVTVLNPGGNEQLQINSAAAGAVFGTQFQYDEDLGATSTTGAAWLDKASITTPALPAGDYLVYAQGVQTGSASNNRTGFRVLVNATPFAETVVRLDNSVNEWTRSAQLLLTGLSGVNTITIQFNKDSGAGTSTMQETRLFFYRVS